jgi:hypothetical protein
MKIAILILIVFSISSCRSGKSSKKRKKQDFSSVANIPVNSGDPNAELSKNEREQEMAQLGKIKVETSMKSPVIKNRINPREVSPFKKKEGNSGKNSPIQVKKRSKARYEPIANSDLESIKATCKKCSRKKVVVTIVVNEAGKVRLEGGQILDSDVVKCLVEKLSKISFYKGPLKKGGITIP